MICDPCRRAGDISLEIRRGHIHGVSISHARERARLHHANCAGCDCRHLVADHTDQTPPWG